VDLADERLSSASAESALREAGRGARKHKHEAHALAAKIILQSYLDEFPDAEGLCQELVRQGCAPASPLPPASSGIRTGGAWLAERLHQELALATPMGALDISFYRDDFDKAGLRHQVKPSQIPFDVNDRHIIVVDDVLYTGRTVRAAMNELFDYGRPGRSSSGSGRPRRAAIADRRAVRRRHVFGSRREAAAPGAGRARQIHLATVRCETRSLTATERSSTCSTIEGCRAKCWCTSSTRPGRSSA